MSTWQLHQQSQHYLPFLLMSQTSIADIQGPIKKKKKQTTTDILAGTFTTEILVIYMRKRGGNYKRIR